MLIKGFFVILALWCHMTYYSSASACVFVKSDFLWYCSNQQLRRIPISTIQNKSASRLDFAYNDITLSSRDMDDLLTLEYRHNITKIIFDYNNITELPENLGEVFPNLEIIYFRNNEITKVKNQFNKLNNLKKLYLDNNPIKMISRSAFRRLSNLEKLSFINTNFTFIPRLSSLSIRNPNLTIDITASSNVVISMTTTTTLSKNVAIDNKSTENNNMSNLGSYSDESKGCNDI